MKKIFSLVFLLFLMNYGLHSQTLSLTSVSNGLQCSYIQVEVWAAGFPDSIGAFTLFIDVDGNVVDCLGATTGTSSVSANQSEYNEIGIVGTNINPVSGIDINGKLCTLTLHYHGGSTGLNWADSCEVVTVDLEEPPVSITGYSNGNVSEGSYTFNTYYVDGSVAVSGSGLSWATAFKTITEAANLALKPGEKVLIKPNTYNEKVTIKSNGGYSVTPQTGIILSDTNKITFPSGANLSCVDLVSYPDQYYAYIYRSWSSNNGYYKVTEVNDALNYIRVEGAAFIPETGTAGNRSKVMAAVGRPIIYKKDPAASESQRVIVNAPVGTTNDALYIGIPGANSQTTADSCNWNILEGIDITNNVATGLKGLHIQCSGYNVYANGKIYNTVGTVGGIGAIITGNSTRNAKYNIIQNCEIYNTPGQAIYIGYNATTSTNNYAYFNHVINNNIYLSGTGSLAKFDNAIRIQNYNRSNVVESNNIHDLKINVINNGALFIGARADSTWIYNNIIRNIAKVNTGTHACVQIDSTGNKIHVFNNLIYNDDTLSNSVYAFRINGRNHAGTRICFNTVHKVDNGFYLQDNSASGSTNDVRIQNNIINPAGTVYFTNVGTSGRFTVTYNLFRNSPGTPYASGTGNLTGDPVFIEPHGSNMYGLILQPTSPAIYSGTPITNISKDYLTDSRSVSAPTRGAFENTMTCTWTGSASTDWNTATNWRLGMVPKNYMPVIIPNVSNDPVIGFVSGTCKSLNLATGATLRLSPSRTLTINN